MKTPACRAGITRGKKRYGYKTTPAGDMAIVYMEADDPRHRLHRTLGKSDEPFNQWFREHVQRVHGFSLADEFHCTGTGSGLHCLTRPRPNGTAWGKRRSPCCRPAVSPAGGMRASVAAFRPSPRVRDAACRVLPGFALLLVTEPRIGRGGVCGRAARRPGGPGARVGCNARLGLGRLES